MTTGCLTLGSGASEPLPSRLTAADARSTHDDLSFEASIPTEGSREGPPKLRLALENRGDLVGGTFGSTPPFSTHGATDDDGTIATLMPEDRSIVVAAESTVEEMIPDEPTEDCWRLRDSPMFEQSSGYRELDTGEELTTEFTVWSPPDEPCLPAGEYSATDTPGAAGGGDFADLTFSFTVE